MSSTNMKTSKSEKRGDRKKLSWIYRKKKKAQSVTQTTNNTDNTYSQNKNGRIIVRNLPFKATEEDIRRLYEPFGTIEEINLLRHPDGKLVGCGFIQFQRPQDAARAIFNTNKKEFLGRAINSSWAIPKSKFCEKLEGSLTQTTEADVVENASTPVVATDDTEKNALKKQKSIEKRQQRKIQKEKSQKKRARIIIRNLAFEATEQDLREHFSKYGPIEDIEILKKEDGQRVGCAFIQFGLVQSAAKAIHYANLNLLLNRSIVVDWAVPKRKFCEQSDNTDDINVVQVKEEKLSDNESESKDEIKTEEPSQSNEDERELSGESEDNGDSSNDETDCEEIDGASTQSIEKESNQDCDDKSTTTRPRFESHDVAEGKTIFLKNVPFSVNNEQLKKYMEQFGSVLYALICMDSVTEHSKGTAFVKFKYKEDAEKCLAAENQIIMEDQIVEAHKALDRNEVENKEPSKLRNKKDSRNLYLVKEGVIQAGSPAAAGVSSADMAKRLRLEQWKSQMLRNLNMFVSRTRLVVHNLPASMDDTKLRKIFERVSNPRAVIREARIMRDLKNLDARANGKSKEYAFVSFSTHEDALHALRSINNNPKIFNANKRPIVAFSIENRIMVNARQKRIERSREQNPLWNGNKLKRSNADVDESTSAKKPKIETANNVEVKQFTGVVSKPGESKLRAKHSFKNQAALHNQTVKKEKKKMRAARKIEIKKKLNMEKKKEVKLRPGMKVHSEDAHFNKLVDSYKTKLQSMKLNKSKWYET